MPETSPIIKAVALFGFLRKASYHRGLVNSAIQICNESVSGIKIEFLEIEPLPFINTDFEVNGTFPPVVEVLGRRFWKLTAFSLLLQTPMKNALDWASRPPNVCAEKTAAIISTGGGFGGRVAQYHLRQVGVFLDLQFINKPEFSVNAFQPP